jgi:hypothetical protein
MQVLRNTMSTEEDVDERGSLFAHESPRACVLAGHAGLAGVAALAHYHVSPDKVCHEDWASTFAQDDIAGLPSLSALLGEMLGPAGLAEPQAELLQLPGAQLAGYSAEAQKIGTRITQAACTTMHQRMCQPPSKGVKSPRSACSDPSSGDECAVTARSSGTAPRSPEHQSECVAVQGAKPKSSKDKAAKARRCAIESSANAGHWQSQQSDAWSGISIHCVMLCIAACTSPNKFRASCAGTYHQSLSARAIRHTWSRGTSPHAASAATASQALPPLLSSRTPPLVHQFAKAHRSCQACLLATVPLQMEACPSRWSPRFCRTSASG